MTVKHKVDKMGSTTKVIDLLVCLLRLPLLNRLGLHRRPQELHRFFKFATVGAVGMLVDLSALNLLFKIVLPPVFPTLTAGTRLLVANSLSVSAAVVSNFTWNRLWTFPESRDRPLVRQLGQFALVNLIGLGINNLVLSAVYLLIRDAIADPFDYNLAKIVAIGVVLFWNYGINRLWTYRGIR
jgi:putative flippase GtrA